MAVFRQGHAGSRIGRLRSGAIVMQHQSEIEVTHDDQAAFWGARDCEYVATFGSYDLDCTVGSGKTPLDAIVDLLDKTE